MNRKISLMLAGVVLAGAAVAQTVPRPAPAPAEAFRFIAAKDVVALTDRPGGRGGTARLTEHDSFFVEYSTRIDTRGGAEQHTHWAHHMQVLEGEGTLIYGGTVTNARDTGGGQIRGDDITGGTTISLHPGDYADIPAGMPHSVRPAPGTRIRYVQFNTRE